MLKAHFLSQLIGKLKPLQQKIFLSKSPQEFIKRKEQELLDYVNNLPKDLLPVDFLKQGIIDSITDKFKPPFNLRNIEIILYEYVRRLPFDAALHKKQKQIRCILVNNNDKEAALVNLIKNKRVIGIDTGARKRASLHAFNAVRIGQKEWRIVTIVHHMVFM